MAGGQKAFELLFQLKATLGPNFNNTFKKAVETQNKLRDSIKSVNSLQAKVDGYTKTSAAIDQQQEKLDRLGKENEDIAQKIQRHEDAMALLKQKIDETGDASGELTAKLSKEKNEVEKATEKLKKNEIQIQQTTATIEKQKKELQNVSTELKQAGIDTDNLENSNKRLQESYERLKNSQDRIKSLNEEQKKIGQSISSTQRQIAGTVGVLAGLAGSFLALDAKTEEYRNNQAKLNTAYQAAGLSANAAKDAYAGFFRILGDNDTATEASQLLAKLTKNEKDIKTWTDIAAGVWGTFGDSLPIEGLIESANETARTGAITGVFADAINWAAKENETFGVTLKENTKANEEWNKAVQSAQSAEDYFNLALQACGSEAERNRLIMDTLKETYQGATDAFYENNKQVLQSRSAQVIYNNILADLGRIAASVKGSLLGMLGVSEDGTVKANSALEKLQGIVSKLADNPELVQTITKVVGGLLLLKAAGLTAKLGFLEIKGGINTVQTALALFKGKSLAASTAGVGLGAKLKTAGTGILSYFSNVGTATKGVVSTVGNAFAGNTIISKAGGFIGKISRKISSGITGMGGKLSGTLTNFGIKLTRYILSPFNLVGGKISSALAGIGGIIAKSPLGSIASFVASGFSRIGTLIAPIGNLITTALGPLGKLGTTILGPLGGIIGKILPVVGVITAVITAVQLLRKNLDKVRTAVGNIFGEKGLEVFDKIVAAVTNIGETIKNVFSDGNIGAARDKINEIFGERGAAVFDAFAGVFQKVISTAGEFVNFVTVHIVPVAEQLLNVLITNVIPGIISGVQAAAPVIMQIFQSIAGFISALIPVIGSFVAGIMPIISEIISFIQAYVLPVVGELFNFLVSTVLPAIAQGIQQVSSIIITVLSAVLPVVQTVFQNIWTIIQPILQQILVTVQAVLPSVLSIFRTVFSTIGSVIQAVTQVLSGLIQFIQGVFTGNWSMAWEGIKTVFQGIWDGITAIAKGAVNGIIGIINGVISALNSIKLPDWVPGVGGKNLNIPTIPAFAGGTKRTPDTFIAGENGPELITNAPGRTVYTAEQTREILRVQNAVAQTAGIPAGAVTNATNNTSQSSQQVQAADGSSMTVRERILEIARKGTNILTIPAFAGGTKRTPDTFIAGENGPELITNAPGRMVYTAEQTREILRVQSAAAQAAETAEAAKIINIASYRNNQSGAQALTDYYSTTAQAPTVNTQAPEVVKSAGTSRDSNENVVTIHNNPTIIVNGDNADDFETKLEENNRRLLRQVKDLLDKKEDDERRSKYA